MYDTVLIPTDGSEGAVAAARRGLAIAEAFDATVHVISVYDIAGTAGPFDAGGVDSEYVDRLESAAREHVREIERLADDPTRVRPAVVEGSPARAILDYAAGEGADLVAMGTHGRRGVRRVVLGSVAERVLRLSGVPVLTVRADGEGERAASGPDPGIERVLLPTDGSDPAAAAVDHAVAVAAAHGATVHVLHVVSVGSLSVGADLTPPTGMLEVAEERGERLAAETVDRIEDAGVDATAAVRADVPASGVLDYADEEGIDLVVMGTHGRTGLDRVLLGSTTERVLRRAAVPVLSVPVAGRGDRDADD